MTQDDRPQINLITPLTFNAEDAKAAARLAAVLDGAEIACLRISLATQDEATLIKSADALRELAHARDVPAVIDNHPLLAERLGLDGVHLPDGARRVRQIRKALGADAIIGAHCAATRHEGIAAGEASADYIAFGPVGEGALGDGQSAPHELFAWWSEMIELPVVAEGALSAALVERFAPVADHFAIGPEIWGADDPLAALRALVAPLGAL